MFPAGTAQTLPEIYAMGFRNPFRIHVDPVTDDIFMGDYGPDAGSTSPTRGPQGSVEFNIVKEPGFYGWPYCVRENVPYHDITYTTDARRGHRQRPLQLRRAGQQLAQQHRPDEPAGGQAGDDVDGLHARLDMRFPDLGSGGAPTGGTVYRYDEDSDSTTKFPRFYDGQWFIGEWNNDWIKTATWNDDGLATGVSCFAICDGLHQPDGHRVRARRLDVRRRVGPGLRREQPRLGRLPGRLRPGLAVCRSRRRASRRTAAPCRWT